VNRRKFLILTAGFATSTVISAKKLPLVVIEPDKRLGLDSHHWQVMDVVLNHLFPSEKDAPGAKDVHATAWIHNALLMPDVDASHLDFIRNGILKLEKDSVKNQNQSFIKLDEMQRETALRKFEEDFEGKSWLRESIRYILEAMLSDPVYGGNTNGVGWKWLKHTPGFPLPTKNKRYYLL